MESIWASLVYRVQLVETLTVDRSGVTQDIVSFTFLEVFALMAKSVAILMSIF